MSPTGSSSSRTATSSTRRCAPISTRPRSPASSRSEGDPMADYEIFELGDVVLQCGKTLRDAKLAYKTFGTLNAAKDNVIVYPTWYSASHSDNEWLIGEGMAL